ncbi:MAG: DUF6261 family protein [Tannerellaceae bacterium]|jgi:hypothetical protein|nr:DUF6261 family protein [Tannerellaceae bacterium]
MKKVNKFASLVKRLRNSDHYEFYREIIRFALKYKEDIGELIKILLAFEAAFNKEDEIFKRSIRSYETPEVDITDQKRISVFRRIKLYVDAAHYDKDPDKQAAATALAFVINNFKTITTVTSTQASALIVNFVQDLRLPKFAPHVATLGLTTDVDDLETANEAFEAVYFEREQNQGNALLEGNMKYARPLTDDGGANFAEGLNTFYAIAKLSGNTAAMAIFGAIIDGINNTIHNYDRKYAHTGSSSGGSKPQPDDDLPDNDIPTFAIAAQATLGTGASGNRMSLLAVDPEAFAAALHPAAEGSVMKIFNAEKDVFENFPVVGFLLGEDGETPTGLIVESFSSKVTFDRPFAGVFDPQTVEILKDDLLLALLTDVLYPATIIDA